MTEIILIRHGVTDENLNYTMIGHTDPLLHEFGILQANALANALTRIEFAAILSSPLLRAKQTAQMIANQHKNVSFKIIQELREIDLGIVDGQSSFKAYERYKEIMDEALDPSNADFAFPEGESRSVALHRFEKVLSSIILCYPTETVCVVTHGGLIGLLLAKLNQLPLGSFRKWQPDHASITRIKARNGDYRVISFNNKIHLPNWLQLAIQNAKNTSINC